MAKITIENTEPRIYSLCDAPLKPGAEMPDTISPGLNEIDAAAWAKVKAVPAVAALVASGVLREVPAAATAAPPAGTGQPGPSLLDMKAGDAIELVKTVGDRVTLEAWYADETRTTVLSAIEAQLASIGG